MTIYSIYKITNSTNSKVYIGWTSRDPSTRFEEHQKTSKPKYQDRSAVSYAIEKYGVDNFTFDIVYQSYDYEHSRTIEAHFIAENNSLVEQWGYNLDMGGTGHKRTESTIEKHRAAITGKKQSAEHIAKRFENRVNPMIGRTGEKHPRHGKVWTEEERQKIKDGIKAANAHKTKMTPEEQRIARREYTRKHNEKKKQQ